MTLGNIFGARGRIGRLTYLKRMAIFAGGLGVVHLALTLVLGERYLDRGGDAILGAVPALLALLAFIGAQHAKRLHDLGLRGGWAWLVMLPPLTLAILLDMNIGPGGLVMAVQVAAVTAALGGLAWTLLAPGTTGPNRFGPQPGDPSSSDPSSSGQLSGEPGERGPASRSAAVAEETALREEMLESAPAASSRSPGLLRRTLSPAGRFGRRSFLLHILLSWGLLLGFIWLSANIAHQIPEEDVLLTINGFALILLVLLFTWYQWVTFVKRFHDRGHSGWVALGAQLAIALPSLAGMLPSGSQVGPLVLAPIIAFLAAFVTLVVAFFLPGNASSNAYGPATAQGVRHQDGKTPRR